MIDTRYGRIVNTASDVRGAELGDRRVLRLKAAVLHFTRCLAMELRAGRHRECGGPRRHGHESAPEFRRAQQPAGSREVRLGSSSRGDTRTFRIGVPLHQLGEAQTSQRHRVLASDEAATSPASACTSTGCSSPSAKRGGVRPDRRSDHPAAGVPDNSPGSSGRSTASA